MRDAEFPDFSAMLEDIAEFYPTAKTPTPGFKAMYFRALRDASLAQVRAGFDAHLRDPDPKRASYMPLPTHILANIAALEADDGRPGAEEAFAIALRTTDERESFVWSDETREAWGIAAVVLAGGDKVGARMAFKEAYTRLVDEARQARRPVRFSLSEGFDLASRRIAHESGVAAGLLLPPPEDADQALQLEGPPVTLPVLFDMAPPTFRERLRALRDSLVKRVEPESEDAKQRQRTDQLRRESIARVAEHESRLNLEPQDWRN